MCVIVILRVIVITLLILRGFLPTLHRRNWQRCSGLGQRASRQYVTIFPTFLNPKKSS